MRPADPVMEGDAPSRRRRSRARSGVDFTGLRCQLGVQHVHAVDREALHAIAFELYSIAR